MTMTHDTGSGGTSRPSRARLLARAFSIRLGDAWLVLLVSALLLLALECGFRAQEMVRTGLRGDRIDPAHPYRDSAWFASYRDEERRSARMEWHPFVYFRRQPFTGTQINIDSAGRRRTVDGVAVPGAPSMLFFGGSTTWGTDARDGGTIPSVVARLLREQGIRNVEVVNYGESGYVLAQGVASLLQQLRTGARPSIVVFYDGINDVAAAVMNGRAGSTQNEENRAAEFEFGRRAFTRDRDFATEYRAFRAIGAAAFDRFLLVQFVRRRGRPVEFADAEVLADQVAAYRAETVRQVASLAETYGFRALFVWQPTLAPTRKPLTQFESSLQKMVDADPFLRALGRVHASMPQRLATTTPESPAVRFLDLSQLFSTDSAPVFTDRLGHVTEAANAKIAAAMLPTVLEFLRRPPH